MDEAIATNVGGTSVVLPLYMTLKQFRERVFPIADSTAWRLIAQGRFPRPAARNGKTAAFRTTELLAWVAAQEAKEARHRPVNVPERRRKKDRRTGANEDQGNAG